MFGIGLGITHLPMRSPAFARPKIIASLIVGIVAAGLYGSVNGTYTNSSSGRTIADHEGLLRSALASESRHGGARRVANLVAVSQDLTNGAWTTTGTGSKTATQITCTNSNYVNRINVNGGVGNGKIFVISFKASVTTGTAAVRFETIDNADGSDIAAITPTLTTDPTRYSFVANYSASTTITTLTFQINRLGTVTAGTVINFTELQAEEVTGQSNQNPSEYVSVGVMPPSTGPQLVTNGTFLTNVSGWSTDSATFTWQSTGSALLQNTAAANGYAYQAITTVIGTKYILYGTTAAGTATSPRMFAGSTLHGAQYGLVQGPATGFLVFTATSTTTYIEFATNSAVSGQNATVNLGSILATVYHGVNVDGVKLFSNENGNTVTSNVVTEATGAAISSSTLLGYLIDPAATNVVLQSSDLTVTWTKNAATISGTKVVGPNGTQTAQKIQEDNTNAAHYVNQPVTLAAGVRTYQVELKQAERTKGWIYMDSAAVAIAYFDLAAGTIGTVSGSGSPSATIKAMANGFYLCTLTATVSLNPNCGHGPTTTDGVTIYTGTTGSGIYAENAQLEAGSVATSHIPTSTIAVSKNKDLVSYPVAGYVNTNDITIPLTWTPGAPPANNGTVNLWGSYVDANNSTLIFHDATSITVRKRIAGVNYDATKALAYTANQTYRIAARFSSTTGIDVFVDGVIGVNHANTANLQLGTTFQVGADGNGVVGGIQYIKNVRPTPSALSASAIGALAA